MLEILNVGLSVIILGNWNLLTSASLRFIRLRPKEMDAFMEVEVSIGYWIL